MSLVGYFWIVKVLNFVHSNACIFFRSVENAKKMLEYAGEINQQLETKVLLLLEMRELEWCLKW